MDEIKVKQLLHVGVVMGIIRDLKIIEMIIELKKYMTGRSYTQVSSKIGIWAAEL